MNAQNGDVQQTRPNAKLIRLLVGTMLDRATGTPLVRETMAGIMLKYLLRKTGRH
ncbi:hypothetical protein M2324_003596 [Rhodovulum sulfidophilum]|uniref:hypothetical protein n=1 Tax=Rhodovulum sulfidophilum TaxID=35806 RepID=UPI000A671C98|nr:hypothetical protein [Rhodovulum sulfidophilum]